jgi:hypothetical protein
MKLEKLLNRDGIFTELVRITNFTTIEECMKVFKKHFDWNDFFTKEKNEKDYKYAYLAGDGQVHFAENLNEFNCSETEEDWRVVYSEIIM